MRRPSILLFALALLILITLSGRVSAELALPANLPGEWSAIGRVQLQNRPGSVVIDGGYVASKGDWGDAEISFRTRAPEGAAQVQLWGGFRYRDRDTRYVFALRGGNNNDLYLARYAPDGGERFLGFSPLGFHPMPGIWYLLRVVVVADRIQIFLNDEKLPRLNVVDPDAPWAKGGVVLGGGWLPAEFADLQVKALNEADKAAFRAIGKQRWSAPAPDKEAIRQRQRAEYAPVAVAALNPQRTEVSLDGNWLFEPDYQLPAGEHPVSADFDDRSWHVMQVPSFWTPGLSWLHGETGFNELEGVSKTKGVADGLYVQEIARCDAYTFDWRRTKSAWYRQYIDLPSDLSGRRFELSFDAIAKISEIWLNGIKVGAHTGLFGEIKCNVTGAVRPGRNLLAVYVNGKVDPKPSARNVQGVAVTVEVTSAMLNSLPHGMLQDDSSGIWQPVKLTITAPVFVSDTFIQPRLNGADIDLDILNSSQRPAGITVDYSITSARDGSLLFESSAAPLQVAPLQTNHVRLSTPSLAPILWSPQDPNLYMLEVRLNDGTQIIDRSTVRFGFRTFTTDGGRFLLNGHPYWLRGGNPFPNTMRPNDAQLAKRFMRIAHDGNIRATRSHIVPFTAAWCDAADEAGIAVSYEGTWPWLMLKGAPPDAGLLKVWKEEYLSLIHKYRNHPSLILWTVNNEMKFEYFDADNPAMLKKKWAILEDMIKAMRQADPTRPIVADSGYVRKESSKSYETVVKPGGIDDGDVDDAHRYYGWYNESFFNLYDGKFGKTLSSPGRPLISQEMATGYPQSDDGHPARYYLFKHHTPQALVGDDAYENADPALFLQRQAFMTKELAETLRRVERGTAAGIFHFSYFTWFRNAWSTIEPWPAYYGIKTALQPVLVSAELYGRHFYAGSTLRRRVCVVNDSEDYAALPPGQLIWEIKKGAAILAHGSQEVPAVPYYANHWLDVDFRMPQTLRSPRVDGQLVLRLEAGGKALSENSYDIVVATADWAAGGVDKRLHNVLLQPHGQSTLLSILPVKPVASVSAAKPGDLLIVDGGEAYNSLSGQVKALREFVSNGGQALLLHPGEFLAKNFPEIVKASVSKQGEIVTMHVPESPVFAGLDPLDLAWFEKEGRELPLACTGIYQIDSSRRDATALASQCDIHAYLDKPSDIAKISGTPLLEIRLGKGRLLASELCLEAGNDDPIARRLLSNIIHYLEKNSR